MARRFAQMRRLRILALVSFIFLVAFKSLAQQPLQSQQPGNNAPAPRPPATAEIRKTVGFLEVTYHDGSTPSGVIGTCFFVFVPDKRLGENQGFGYLVTNRHVAQPGIESGTPHEGEEVVLRMNLVSPEGGNESAVKQIPLGGRIHWFFPSDEAVDLAVLPFAPDQKQCDYLKVPLSLIVGPDQIASGDIGVGDPVVFAGYFSNFPGTIRMEPIVREGVIAMLPEEKLNTTLQKEGKLFLADLHAFHGNSGSPVFVNLAGVHHGSVVLGEDFRLLGVISGYYPESASFSVPAATVLTGEVHDNSGIATIVPGEELLKLLNSPELQADRDSQVKILTKSP